MKAKLNLTEIIDVIEGETSGDEINLGELVEVLNSRGFGPLILIPAIICILPTGAIPFMPDVCALMIIFICAQILLRRKHPWIPQKLKNFSFKRKNLTNYLEKAKPTTKKIDSHIHPRLQILTRKGVEPFIAILCILLALGMIVMSWIPFLAMLPAAGVFFLGLALTTRDGFLLLTSFLFIVGSIASVPYVWLNFFGS